MGWATHSAAVLPAYMFLVMAWPSGTTAARTPRNLARGRKVIFLQAALLCMNTPYWKRVACKKMVLQPMATGPPGRQEDLGLLLQRR